MNYDPKHQINPTPRASQSQEAGRNQQRVPADCASGTTDPNVGVYSPDGDTLHFSAGGSRSALRAESYARACRSRAAVLCASTDAPSSVYRTVPGSVSRAFDASAYVGESEFLRTEDPS